MGENGLAKKFLLAGLVAGVLILLVRQVRGGDDEAEGIDRIDTGNERNEDHVDTGLDRVSTNDDDDDGEDDEAADEAASDEAGTVPVQATSGGRFDGLDVFDYVAILGAAFKAAKREYESRT